jgi:DNA polymerase III delta' subunit
VGFDDVLGNSRVKKILRLALQKNRVPNSLIFSGPKGVGKRSLALVLAKAINCEKKKDDACEECPSCLAITGRRMPDVWTIEPEKQILQIDQMRAMRQAAYLRPMMSRKRIFIIDEAEKMNEAASNCLLKILEEPPLFSHIILLTANPDLILPTIRSRCQVLQFSPIGKKEIERVLAEKGYSEDRAKIMSLLVRGNLEEALDLDWDEVQEKRQEAWNIFLSFLGKKEASAFVRSYAFGKRSMIWEDLERTLEIVASFCRDFILLKEGGEPSLLLNPDYRKEIEPLTPGWSLAKAGECLGQIETVISGLSKHLNISLLVSSFYSLMGENNHA